MRYYGSVLVEVRHLYLFCKEIKVKIKGEIQAPSSLPYSLPLSA